MRPVRKRVRRVLGSTASLVASHIFTAYCSISRGGRPLEAPHKNKPRCIVQRGKDREVGVGEGFGYLPGISKLRDRLAYASPYMSSISKTTIIAPAMPTVLQ